MLSLRAAATRTRAIHPVLTSFRRPIGNDSKPDKEKRPTPSRLIGHAPEWSEELATASEVVVKADRDKTTINEMQQKTVDYARSHQHDPEAAPTHATYARDEVGGPLGSAGVGEFEGVVGNDDLGPEAPVESNGRVVTRRVIHEKS